MLGRKVISAKATPAGSLDYRVPRHRFIVPDILIGSLVVTAATLGAERTIVGMLLEVQPAGKD